MSWAVSSSCHRGPLQHGYSICSSRCGASGRREVEQGPEWFDRSEVTRILAGIGQLLNQFAGPPRNSSDIRMTVEPPPAPAASNT